MAHFGKKILSAFVEVTDEKKKTAPTQAAYSAQGSPDAAGTTITAHSGAIGATAPGNPDPDRDQRFTTHFDQLFSEANIPGPDYYEFSRMIVAMQLIPDESARFLAAYAGLRVQGLSRERLLTTAAEYLRVLAVDADNFQKTVDTALQEKVDNLTADSTSKALRIQALSQEILDLQKEVSALQVAIRDNQEKLIASSSGYKTVSEQRKQQIQSDIEKINRYLPADPGSANR